MSQIIIEDNDEGPVVFWKKIVGAVNLVVLVFLYKVFHVLNNGIYRIIKRYERVSGKTVLDEKKFKKRKSKLIQKHSIKNNNNAKSYNYQQQLFTARLRGSQKNGSLDLNEFDNYYERPKDEMNKKLNKPRKVNGVINDEYVKKQVQIARNDENKENVDIYHDLAQISPNNNDSFDLKENLDSSDLLDNKSIKSPISKKMELIVPSLKPYLESSDVPDLSHLTNVEGVPVHEVIPNSQTSSPTNSPINDENDNKIDPIILNEYADTHNSHNSHNSNENNIKNTREIHVSASKYHNIRGEKEQEKQKTPGPVCVMNIDMEIDKIKNFEFNK